MSNDLKFSPYSSGDESAILELFQGSFGKEMRAEYWHWRFRDNSTGQIMIELAWDDEMLVAHYAVSPVILTIRGQDHLTALSMTTMTHPHYRGRRLFPILSNRLYERLRHCNYSTVWGFPNNQSHHTFVNRLAWDDIYEIPLSHLNIDNLPKMSEVSQCIVELSTFDEKFDILWEKIKMDCNIWVKRDRKYLNWRYNLNPQHKYHILAYIDNNEMLGYAVYKIYGSDIDVVDIVTIREKNIGEELIISILDMSLQQGNIKGINMWLPLHHSLHKSIEKIGFLNMVPVTYFSTRVLDDCKQYKVDFAKYSNWYVQLGDSDVY